MPSGARLRRPDGSSAPARDADQRPRGADTSARGRRLRDDAATTAAGSRRAGVLVPVGRGVRAAAWRSATSSSSSTTSRDGAREPAVRDRPHCGGREDLRAGLEIDGALEVQDELEGSVTIFIAADVPELERRLRDRATGTGEIEERIALALAARAGAPLPLHGAKRRPGARHGRARRGRRVNSNSQVP